MDLPARPAAPRAGGEGDVVVRRYLLAATTSTVTPRASAALDAFDWGDEMSKPEDEAAASADEGRLVRDGSRRDQGDEPTREGSGGLELPRERPIVWPVGCIPIKDAP